MDENWDRSPKEEAGKRFRRLLSEVENDEHITLPSPEELLSEEPQIEAAETGAPDGGSAADAEAAGVAPNLVEAEAALPPGVSSGETANGDENQAPVQPEITASHSDTPEAPVDPAASEPALSAGDAGTGQPGEGEQPASGPGLNASLDAAAGSAEQAPQADEPALEDTQPRRPLPPVPSPQPPAAPISGETQVVSRRPSYGNVQGSGPQATLPRRVDEIDRDATRVTPAAYSASSQSVPTPSGRTRRAAPASSYSGAARRAGSVWDADQTGQPIQRASAPGYSGAPPSGSRRRGQNASVPPRSFDMRSSLGCLARILVFSLFALVLLAVCGGSILVYMYYDIARELPDVTTLREKTSQFETTRILDRNGNVLYEILDPNAGRRTYVPLSKISPYLVAATIATEDRNFYSHPGFDVLAIFRAFWQNYQSGETVSGASTITQQLARALLFEPEEATEQSYIRKIREAVLAAEITRRYTKDEILELYLNEIYYGNLAYGIEAAASTYFGTTASALTLGQASFLAGLPQTPAVYDVHTNPEITFKRQEDVLVLMYEASQQEGCIYVSNSPQRVCLDPVAAAQAANEVKTYDFRSPDVQMRFPHWVNYIRYLLEQQYDPQTIYRSGFTVYTTIDPALQEAAERVIKEQVEGLADRHVSDGALIAIRPSTGEVLAMVGSADFYNEEISGQVNMAISPRQPGSAMKPMTYLAAFELGWTPATLLWDVPSEFSPSGLNDPYSQPYIPVNYDGRFNGPVTVRTALANSLNIPAVKALDFVEVYDNPNTPEEDGLISFARRVGITTLNQEDYGLSLTLGGGEVTLLELTNFYATLANGGRRLPPVAITSILDHAGNQVYQYQTPGGDQVVRPEHAYLISSILSDNEARAPMFGLNSVLNLPFPAAAKTGTTNDFRDNWTLGYNPDVAVGVWVGNADYTPMQDTTGLTGAAPAWAAFMQTAVETITGGNPTPFSRPAGIVEYVVCSLSGTQPSEWCPSQLSEIFAADQPPLPKEHDLWQRVEVDTWTGLKASPACSDFTEERFVLNITDSWAKKWLRRNEEGRRWLEDIGFDEDLAFTPERECQADDPRPVLGFASLRDGQRIVENPLDIYAQAGATAWFDFWTLEYGLGDDPVEWDLLMESSAQVNQPDLIYTWDLSDVTDGPVTLRLTLFSTEGSAVEKELTLDMAVPTPTPTVTPTPTQTATPTQTLLPTGTPTATQVPSQTPVPTEPPSEPTQAPPPSAVPTTLSPALTIPTGTREAP